MVARPREEVGFARGGDLRSGHSAGVVRKVALEARAARRRQAEDEHRDEAGDTEAGERRHDAVERSRRQDDHTADDRQDDQRPDEAGTAGDRPRRVGEPGIRVFEEVAAGADADDARSDLQVAQDERDLERDDQDRRDHERPRFHPSEERVDDAAREDVIAARARHDGRQ